MKVLCLILSAGKGSRVKDFLTPEQPIKQLIRYNGKCVIDHVIDSVAEAGCEIAILSCKNRSHSALNNYLTSKGYNLLFEKAPRIELPFLLELPFILICQYFISRDRGFLKQFDSIITVPSDLVLLDVDFKRFVNHHRKATARTKRHVVTFLSKESDGGGRACYFKMCGSKIDAWQMKPPEKYAEEYSKFTQAGIYAFSRSLLDNPFTIIAPKSISMNICETDGRWLDFGDPEVLRTHIK